MAGAPDHVAVEPRCVLALVVTLDPMVVEDLVQDLQYNNDHVVVDDVQCTATGEHGHHQVFAVEPVVAECKRTNDHVTTLVPLVEVDIVLDNLWNADLVEEALVQLQ